MKYFRRFQCWLFGHRFVSVSTGKNERSIWGWFVCSRCGKSKSYQYDGVGDDYYDDGLNQ